MEQKHQKRKRRQRGTKLNEDKENWTEEGGRVYISNRKRVKFSRKTTSPTPNQ